MRELCADRGKAAAMSAIARRNFAGAFMATATSQEFFPRPTILPGLAAADNGGARAFDQNFGGKRARVIIGGHDKAVRARAHQRQIIAFAHLRQAGGFCKRSRSIRR